MVKIPLILLAAASVYANAYEADYFTRREGYQDSALVLNQKMNETLTTIGLNSRSCDEGLLHKSIIRAMGGTVVGSIEHWADSVPGNFTPSLNDSVYSGLTSEAPFLSMGCCATIMKVGDSLISGDKLGHFLQSGFEMYYVVRSKSEHPIQDARGFFTRFVGLVWESPISGPQINAIMDRLDIRYRVLNATELERFAPAIVGEVSTYQESMSMGSASTAVKSYADMASNYGGYLFWKQLTSGPKPYFTCQGGRWQLTREFDWREYVTDAWDEAINCNEYTTPRMKSTVEQRVYDLASQNNWPSQTCPVVPAKCAPLAGWYGEISKWILHPDCRTQTYQGM